MKRVPIITTLALLAAAGGFALAACGANDATSAGKVPSSGSSGGALAAKTESNSSTASAPTGRAKAGDSAGRANDLRVQVWFVGQGGALVPVTEKLQQTPRVATAALEALLDGPPSSALATAVPVDAQLLGVRIEKRVATVNFTSEYESGGGELSMQLRLGQVVYTLTQFRTVQGVRFELDGKPVNVFSSEGIVLDHPVSRADYDDLVPVIVVDTPTPGQNPGNPLRVTGTANVFEANVQIEVLDARGNVVGKTFTTATCGTGCRGRFSVRVPYTVSREQHGTILVHDDDADGDGRPQHTVRVPVNLVPAE